MIRAPQHSVSRVTNRDRIAWAANTRLQPDGGRCDHAPAAAETRTLIHAEMSTRKTAKSGHQHSEQIMLRQQLKAEPHHHWIRREGLCGGTLLPSCALGLRRGSPDAGSPQRGT